ncbi:hypothetical protein [Ornithinimicrobium sp. INDO-MA30-4]|uniref:hypothetical protein n=1 Tax=Ornithinimicrobium sp. INDO-MA30-4 TaxID=2908651 RepID=UPI001F443B4C|nr:hypothetical protein [Ornithinimicrobium sp. INDO-MA30-4]UJH69536.1 hypothetical protein L0A91_09145 [Ornithinimicrobium sp. INDO-MA30-4]
MHPTHIPLRVATGAFILNSGLGKIGADKETAEGTHGMAATAYPFLKNVKPKDFTEVLAYPRLLSAQPCWHRWSPLPSLAPHWLPLAPAWSASTCVSPA